VLHTNTSSDWPAIATLYERLARITQSPVVELNRAVALAEVAGPDIGLRAVERLSLDGYQYLHAARAELLARLGRSSDARRAYERALQLVRSEPERRFLQRRISELPVSAPVPAPATALDAADEEADRPQQQGDDQHEPQHVRGEPETSEDRQDQHKRQ
jgi:hypothetical protein